MAEKEEKQYIWLVPPITVKELEMLKEQYGVILEGYTETAKQMKEAFKEISSQFESPKEAEVLYPQPKPALADKFLNWWWDNLLRGEPSKIKDEPYTDMPIRIEIPGQKDSGEQKQSASDSNQTLAAQFYPLEQYEDQLVRLQEYKDQELEIVSEAEARRHKLESHFSDLTRKITERNLSAEISAYQSAAGSMAKFLGAGIKEQALIMIPFEIAEATKEMADFLATKDPSHLAASLKHALAVKQYADAAKTSASGGGAGSGSGGGSSTPTAEPGRERIDRRARVVVNVGDGVVINPKEFTRQLVDGLNEAYNDNVIIEFA